MFHQFQSVLMPTHYRRGVERERQNLMSEKERLLSAVRKHESDALQMRLSLSELKGQLRDKEALEKRIEEMKSEQSEAHTSLKVISFFVQSIP